MAKVNPNYSPYSTVVQANNVSFTVRATPPSSTDSYVTSYTHSGIVYLNADYGNTPGPFSP